MFSRLEFIKSENRYKTPSSELGELVVQLPEQLKNSMVALEASNENFQQFAYITIASTALPISVKTFKESINYYKLDVTDNGIGFDNTASLKIFQVNKRLNGIVLTLGPELDCLSARK